MSASFVLPAFSPALLLRPLLRPVPLPLFRRTANMLLRRMHRQHPGVAARLKPIAGTSFLISAAEMPYAIRLEVAPDGRLCIPSHASPDADVHVYGTVDGLLGMLEGERDGDALFFSRELKVEGDTEALLTLRNALDSEALHLAELLVPAPLLPVAGSLHRSLRHIHHALREDMACVADALNGKLEKRCNALEESLASLRKENGALQDKVARMEKRMQKAPRGAPHDGA